MFLNQMAFRIKFHQNRMYILYVWGCLVCMAGGCHTRNNYKIFL